MRHAHACAQVHAHACTGTCTSSRRTLDLGFNKSLDSRLPRVRDFFLDKFDEQIDKAFEDYPEEKLDALFDMKIRVLECIRTSK